MLEAAKAGAGEKMIGLRDRAWIMGIERYV